jgi:hypothetical protein
MPSLYPAPKEATIETLLGGLVSVAARVSKQDVQDPERDATGVFAEFVTDADELAVLAFADPELVNFVGGAIIETPLETIQAANQKRVLDDGCLDGFREVVNVFASCLNSKYTPHLRLSQVTVLPGQLTDEVKQLWRQPRGRRAFKVDLDAYGPGTAILYMS